MDKFFDCPLMALELHLGSLLDSFEKLENHKTLKDIKCCLWFLEAEIFCCLNILEGPSRLVSNRFGTQNGDQN